MEVLKNLCSLCGKEHCGDVYDCYDCVEASGYCPSDKLKQQLLASGYRLEKKEKITLIVLGFPGVGRSYLKKYLEGSNIKVLECDSCNPEILDKSSLDSYFDFLEFVYKDFDIILLSSNSQIRNRIKQSILKDNCFICVCYPNLSMKDYWIKLLEHRGESDEFLNLMRKNYDKWITELSNEDIFYKIELDETNNSLAGALNSQYGIHQLNKKFRNGIRR